MNGGKMNPLQIGWNNPSETHWFCGHLYGVHVTPLPPSQAPGLHPTWDSPCFGTIDCRWALQPLLGFPAFWFLLRKMPEWLGGLILFRYYWHYMYGYRIVFVVRYRIVWNLCAQAIWGRLYMHIAYVSIQWSRYKHMTHVEVSFSC